MNGNVVSLQDHKQSQAPHIRGKAHCLSCKHEWEQVAPIGTTELNCPACASFKGLYKGFTAPETSWECSCGSLLFFIAPNGCMCSNCGVMADLTDGDNNL
jgi:hypothetical protein